MHLADQAGLPAGDAVAAVVAVVVAAVVEFAVVAGRILQGPASVATRRLCRAERSYRTGRRGRAHHQAGCRLGPLLERREPDHHLM